MRHEILQAIFRSFIFFISHGPKQTFETVAGVTRRKALFYHKAYTQKGYLAQQDVKNNQISALVIDL